MKTLHIKSIIAALAVSCSLGASAQALHTGYFLEGMVQRHELNAAFGGETNYIAIPGISGLSMSATTNFGLSNFVFKNGDNLALGFSSQVKAEDFLNNLPINNQVELNVELPILSVGFRAFGGFNTLVIKERSFVGVNVPSSLFRFLKLGADPSTGIANYDIENLTVNTNNYVELALGHSRKLPALEGFSYGAKAKFLVGIFNANLSVDKLNIELSDQRWLINAQGHMAISSGITPVINENGSFSTIDASGLFIGGFGFGVDLGAVYTPAAIPELTVSLGLNDLGFIGWNNMSVINMKNRFEYTGLNKLDETLEGQVNDLVDNLSGLLKLQDGGAVNQSRMLQTTLNVAAEYAVLNRKISFGLLSSTRFGAPYTYAEGMAVVNFRPVHWFHVALNGSVSTQGAAVGGLISICPNGVNLFLGCDYISPNMKFSKEFIPLYGTRVSLRTGIVITFGKDKSRY